MATLGELPPRCLERCPVTEVPLEEYDLCLRRNCQGPVSEVTPETSSVVRIERDGSIQELPVERVHMDGGVICRNQGLVELINARLDQTGKEV